MNEFDRKEIARDIALIKSRGNIEDLAPDFKETRAELLEIGPKGFVVALGINPLFGPQTMYSEYSERWIRFYNQKFLHFRDPVFLTMLNKPGLDRWSEIPTYPTSKVAEYAAAHGLKYGGVSSRGRFYKRDFVSVAREDRELTFDELYRLEEILDSLIDLSNGTETLSDKEIETLRFLANGGTSQQAFVELNISESGYRNRINSAKKKLGCTTTMQLVAKASSQHLLD